MPQVRVRDCSLAALQKVGQAKKNKDCAAEPGAEALLTGATPQLLLPRRSMFALAAVARAGHAWQEAAVGRCAAFPFRRAPQERGLCPVLRLWLFTSPFV